MSKESKALIAEIDAEKAQAQRERFKGVLKEGVRRVERAEMRLADAMHDSHEAANDLVDLKAMTAEEYCEKNLGWAQGGIVSGLGNLTINCTTGDFVMSSDECKKVFKNNMAY